MIYANINTNDKTLIDSSSISFYNDGGSITYNKTGIMLLNSSNSFDLSFNELTFNGISSTEGQIVMANISGKPVWSDLPSNALSDILLTNNDANFNTISNIGELKLSYNFQSDISGGPITISQDSSSKLSISMNTSTYLIDKSRDTKEFSGNYMRIMLNGEECFLPIFKNPPPLGV